MGVLGRLTVFYLPGGVVFGAIVQFLYIDPGNWVSDEATSWAHLLLLIGSVKAVDPMIILPWNSSGLVHLFGGGNVGKVYRELV